MGVKARPNRCQTDRVQRRGSKLLAGTFPLLVRAGRPGRQPRTDGTRHSRFRPYPAALRYFGVGGRDRRQISPASTKQPTPQTTKTVSKRRCEPSFGAKAQETAHAANSAATPVHATTETTATRTVEDASAAPNCADLLARRRARSRCIARRSSGPASGGRHSPTTRSAFERGSLSPDDGTAMPGWRYDQPSSGTYGRCNVSGVTNSILQGASTTWRCHAPFGTTHAHPARSSMRRSASSSGSSRRITSIEPSTRYKNSSSLGCISHSSRSPAVSTATCPTRRPSKSTPRNSVVGIARRVMHRSDTCPDLCGTSRLTLRPNAHFDACMSADQLGRRSSGSG